MISSNLGGRIVKWGLGSGFLDRFWLRRVLLGCVVALCVAWGVMLSSGFRWWAQLRMGFRAASGLQR